MIHGMSTGELCFQLQAMTLSRDLVVIDDEEIAEHNKQVASLLDEISKVGTPADVPHDDAKTFQSLRAGNATSEIELLMRARRLALNKASRCKESRSHHDEVILLTEDALADAREEVSKELEASGYAATDNKLYNLNPVAATRQFDYLVNQSDRVRYVQAEVGNYKAKAEGCSSNQLQATELADRIELWLRTLLQNPAAPVFNPTSQRSPRDEVIRLR